MPIINNSYNQTVSTTTNKQCYSVVKPSLDEFCGDTYNIDCILYSGPDNSCYDVKKGDKVKDILKKIIDKLGGANCTCEFGSAEIDCIEIIRNCIEFQIDGSIQGIGNIVFKAVFESYQKNLYTAISIDDESGVFTSSKIKYNEFTNRYELYLNNEKIAYTTVSNLQTSSFINWKIYPNFDNGNNFINAIFENAKSKKTICPTTTTSTTTFPPTTSTTSTTSTTTCSVCCEPICGQTYEGYGYLYNWHAIWGTGEKTNGGRNEGGIVNANQPGFTDERNDWRVPTDQDWNDLTEFLDPEFDPEGTPFPSLIAGGKLKTTCLFPFTTNNGLWNTPNQGATNQYNWAGIPGGTRSLTTSFIQLKDWGYWWSSTQLNTDDAWMRALSSQISSLLRTFVNKERAHSLRLVRPATSTEFTSLLNGTTSNINTSLPHYVGNDGREYITVKIGNQVWTAQNLMEEMYNDGSTISLGQSDTAWELLSNLESGARCSYPVNPDGSEGQIELCGEPI